MLHLLCSSLEPPEPKVGQIFLSNTTETWNLNVWKNTNAPVLKEQALTCNCKGISAAEGLRCAAEQSGSLPLKDFTLLTTQGYSEIETDDHLLTSVTWWQHTWNPYYLFSGTLTGLTYIPNCHSGQRSPSHGCYKELHWILAHYSLWKKTTMCGLLQIFFC